MALLINNEPIALVQGAGQRAIKTFTWEVEGKESAEARWTELDQEDPAGRYRVRVQDDKLRFERATLADWADYRALMTVTASGVVLEVDQTLEELLAMLLYEVSELNTLVAFITK